MLLRLSLISRVGGTSAAIGSLLLCGCAQIAVNKAEKVWEIGKARLVGMRESEFRQCAGEPNAELPTRAGSRLRYGYAETYDFGGASCILNLDVSDGLIRRYTIESQNPGGLTDGSFVCAVLIDDCFGDGTLENTMRNSPGTNTAGRMVGDLNTQSAAFGAAARQARDVGMASSIGLAAGLARGNASAPTVLEPMAAPRQDRPRIIGQTSSQPQPQRSAANSTGTGAGATSSRQPASSGVPGAVNPPPEASRSPSAAAESAPKVALDSQLISNGAFNLWRIKVTNSSANAVRCFVSATYGYADPNGTGKIVWDSSTRTVTVPARSSGNADYGMRDRNIQTDSYRLLSCDWI